jgi:phospholipid transport system substrate-binding protein
MRRAGPKLRRRHLLLAASFASALVRWSVPARANTAPGVSAGGIDSGVRRLYAGLEQVMRDGRSTPFPRRFALLAPLVEQAFDLETVLRVSIGPRWESLDPATRAQLLAAYQRFTVATYVANFDANDGEQLRILPGVRDSGQDQIIHTELVPAHGAPVRIDYVMRREQGVWRAVDILLDGTISRVAVQRSDFRKILATGNAAALIANLRKKTADLSDGTLAS